MPTARCRVLDLRHLAAAGLLVVAAVANSWDWFAGDRMPGGDFPGYAAEIQYVRDSLLEHGRVPLWCLDCYGGATNFTGHLKEYLAFPAAVWGDPVLAGKLLSILLRWLSALGLYALVVRFFGSPLVGVIAAYAYGFGAFANHQLEHSDLAMAAALLPPVAIAAVALVQTAAARWMLALGALMAIQFLNNWVQALPTAVGVLALLALRPMNERPEEQSLWRDRRLALRWSGLLTGLLLVFLILTGSQLSWLIADAPNHRLAAARSLTAERTIYVERSPFLYVNRDNVLGPWLEEHHPPGLLVAEWDKGRRYLGVVVLAICLAAWVAVRRDAQLRRWAALAAGMFVFQYWLSLGPTTLLWQVGESLHWGRELMTGVRTGLLTGSAACLLAAAGLAVAARTGRVELRRDWLGRLAATAVLLFFPTHSLWSELLAVVPLLEVQRSPAHFFETATFWLYLFFAVALVALERSLVRKRLVRPLLALLALAVVVDFWPSTEMFSSGSPMEPIRNADEMVAALDGEGGTLRMAMPRVYHPLTSWVAAQAEPGHAWGWLPWQSGRHWTEFMSAAVWQTRLGPETDRQRETEGLYSMGSRALLSIGRIRYFLLSTESGRSPVLPSPWRRTGSTERFSVWRQPDVSPMATGHRRYTLHAGPPDPDAAAALTRAAARGELVVFARADWADSTDSREGTRDALLSDPSFEVHYSRPGPEHIRLETDAGSEPAMVFVSEGYHPWWRATVDGHPAPVLRAQMAFMAVPIGANARTIELRLERPRLVAGADHLSAAAWALLVIGACGMALRRRLIARRGPG